MEEINDSETFLNGSSLQWDMFSRSVSAWVLTLQMHVLDARGQPKERSSHWRLLAGMAFIVNLSWVWLLIFRKFSKCSIFVHFHLLSLVRLTVVMDSSILSFTYQQVL